MRTLVDTSVWSLALRRASGPVDPAAAELRRLIHEGRVAMIGAIRQEILSGIRDSAAFRRLRDHLRSFPDDAMDAGDYERAAEFFNRCRAKGIQGSNTDFLLCAVAERRGWPLLTTDRDFQIYRKHLPIVLHVVRT